MEFFFYNTDYISPIFYSIIEANDIPEKYRFDDSNGDYYLYYRAQNKSDSIQVRASHQISGEKDVQEKIRLGRGNPKIFTINKDITDDEQLNIDNYIMDNRGHVESLITHAGHISQLMDDVKQQINMATLVIEKMIEYVEREFEDMIVASNI